MIRARRRRGGDRASAAGGAAAAGAGAARGPGRGGAAPPRFDALLLPEGGERLANSRGRSGSPGSTRRRCGSWQRAMGRARHRQRKRARRRLVCRLAAGAEAGFRGAVQATYGRTRRAWPRSATTPRHSPPPWRREVASSVLAPGDPRPARVHGHRRPVPLQRRRSDPALARGPRGRALRGCRRVRRRKAQNVGY